MRQQPMSTSMFPTNQTFGFIFGTIILSFLVDISAIFNQLDSILFIFQFYVKINNIIQKYELKYPLFIIFYSTLQEKELIQSSVFKIIEYKDKMLIDILFILYQLLDSPYTKIHQQKRQL
ncbi:hypothetical protein pb186bvf_002881 [Paramecium bursaria]